MTAGPGKYESVAAAAREATSADAIVLVVLGGHRGDGTSVQVASLGDMKKLPSLLRELAVRIEADLAALEN